MESNQIPCIRVMPEYESSLGGTATEMMGAYGLTMDQWQSDIQNDWLAFGKDGKYAASMCGLSVPRQNGKTANVKGRCIVGICVLNEQILYTAHEVKTARKTFDEMAEMFDPNGAFPDLAAQVDYIRRANGQEEIKLVDWQDENGDWQPGGRIIFSARSRGASRGFTCDVLICDEAQELTDEQMAALMPVISAGRNQNSQTILIGTPPAPGCMAEVFTSTRRKALGPEPGRICWHEWSVDEVGDTTDWDRVRRTNPAFGIRLMESAVSAEMSAMAPDYFARERLGWWSKQSASAVIDKDEWESLKTDNPPNDGLFSYAVKFSPDGAIGTLAVCLKPTDGKPHVEVIESKRMNCGISWFVDWLEARKTQAAQITIDGMANAQPLVDELTRRGVTPNAICKPRSADMAAACSDLLNAVHEGRITHYDQPALNDSALKSKKRAIGNGGGWGFADNDCDSTLIEACALAYWGAMTTRRNPTRKQRIGF